MLSALTGCAALHPIQGIPLDRVDPCLIQPERPRSDERTIDLSLLSQNRPTAHVVDSGDVLGIYVEGVLGSATTGPPVVSPSLGATPDGLTTATIASANLGFPITVRDDGTISLPYKPSIPVRGRTLGEVELMIRDVYSGPDGLLQPGRDRIFVTLHKPRTVRVLVVRKDRPLEPSYAQQPDYRRADEGRGTAVLVELPAFENDVLHALVASGGLPGPDAENAVYVMRADGGMACSNGFGSGYQQFGPSFPMRPSLGHSVMSSPVVPPRLSSNSVSDAKPIHGGIELASARVLATVPVPSNLSMANSRTLLGHSVVQPFASRTSLTQQSISGATYDPWGAQPPAVASNQQLTTRLPVGHGTTLQASTPSAQPIQPAGFRTPLPRRQIGMPVGPTVSASDSSFQGPAVRRISLGVLPGEIPTFCKSDVLLDDGDIIFIESRSQEYFYTAGLLGGGKYPLPRNEDTDLLDAIAIADSQRRVLPTRQIGGVSSLSQDVTVGASKVVIFRQNGAGPVVPIKVDLNRLKRDPSRSPVIKPGDRVVLQYSPLEAVAATFERHLLEGTVLGVASAVSFGAN